MKSTFMRLILAPRTSWRALRLLRADDAPLDFDAAWRRARTQLCPDETVYRDYGHGPTKPIQAPLSSRNPAPTRSAPSKQDG
ncbi:hypothetical protein GCM10010442_01420 [Kitasatospora kifunensis]